MGSTVIAFPYGDLPSAKIHDGTAAQFDTVETMHD